MSYMYALYETKNGRLYWFAWRTRWIHYIHIYIYTYEDCHESDACERCVCVCVCVCVSIKTRPTGKKKLEKCLKDALEDRHESDACERWLR